MVSGDIPNTGACECEPHAPGRDTPAGCRGARTPGDPADREQPVHFEPYTASTGRCHNDHSRRALLQGRPMCHEKQVGTDC